MSDRKRVGHPGPSATTVALRYGRSGAALQLNGAVCLPGPTDRWRPLPDVPGALELVDQQGNPRGWVYAPKSWALGTDEDGGGRR